MKRTRHIKKWFITIPRVAIREPGVYQIKVKISQVVTERIKDLPRRTQTTAEGVILPAGDLGEGKDRGQSDPEEERR